MKPRSRLRFHQTPKLLFGESGPTPSTLSSNLQRVTAPLRRPLPLITPVITRSLRPAETRRLSSTWLSRTATRTAHRHLLLSHHRLLPAPQAATVLRPAQRAAIVVITIAAPPITRLARQTVRTGHKAVMRGETTTGHRGQQVQVTTGQAHLHSSQTTQLTLPLASKLK